MLYKQTTQGSIGCALSSFIYNDVCQAKEDLTWHYNNWAEHWKQWIMT